MDAQLSWPKEFAAVIACERCSGSTDRRLLRDSLENVPQPGFIGDNYWSRRVLLIGQNPGTPKSRRSEADRPYTAALRALRGNPTEGSYQHLRGVLKGIIPQWPVGNYFSLAECGLTLEDIAYCNVVRCRTVRDASPSERTALTCSQSHLARWVFLLAPLVVVFIGRWAFERGHTVVDRSGIPCDYMNRQRSFSSEARRKNRDRVSALVRRLTG